MILSFFSLVCLICVSFVFGLLTCLYLISQISESEDLNCQSEPEVKIGYKRNTIINNK